ncbi:type II toxin-antitoxin system MqsR family toxin [Flavobacterium sp. 245]|uniref:type II toxin-antitoxin system MqsR family toxin n=1 Tax=Flavobacterium sp. 245 TaxID=2512115 RepID=UPI00105BEEF6|nr:type II toxin-antitoxin system MqsR family toxin [Flavobacterium sp. 245]
MTTESDVKMFLSEFKAKLDVFSVIFRDDRTVKKNTVALLALDLLPAERKEFLRKLAVEDYSQGPTDDALYKLSPMWVFGKVIKGKEVYIKITIGSENLPVICISFHQAESAMTYPFKK